MSRAAEQQAKDTYKSAQGANATATGNANELFGTLMPIYQKEAQAPTGFAPGDLAAMNTAAQQSSGGAVAGAVGANNQMAARTRNRGGFQIANDEAARMGMRNNSQAAVENQGKDAMLKEAHQQEGIAGMSGLYGQNLNELMQSLGAENNSTGELNQAGQHGWLQNTLGVLNAGANVGKSAAGLGAHF